jgi:hypothetical protein
VRFALPSFLDIRQWNVLGIDAEVSAGSVRQDLLRRIISEYPSGG